MRNSNFLPHVDALRGLAIILVLFYHLDLPYFQGGFIGVDIFFVISGYLITKIITQEIQEGRFSLLQFYARRIKRIFPAFFFVLLATFIGSLLFLPPLNFSTFLDSLIFASLQSSNIFFYQNYDYFRQGTDIAPLLHTWTLGVEAQFYMLWAVLCLFLVRAGSIRTVIVSVLLLGFISLGLSEYLVEGSRLAAFYLLPSRIWEFMIGALLALRILPAVTNRIIGTVLLVSGTGILILCAHFLDDGSFPGFKAILPCLGAALVIHSAQDKPSLPHKLFSNRLAVGTGLISYSLYLWHWPLISLYKSYFSYNLTAPAQISIAALSFILAFLSYKFIEKPTQAMRVDPRKVLAIGLSVIAVFVVVSVAVEKVNKNRIALAGAMDKVEIEPNKYYAICGKKGGVYKKEDCTFGPHKDRYEVIIAGDSHALHYAPTVVEWANKNGMSVRLFAQGGCQTFVKREGSKKCDDLSGYFLQTLKEDKSIKYVFLALMTPVKDAQESIAQIQKYNKKIVYLGRVPMFKQPPHNCRMRKDTIAADLFGADIKSCFSLDEDYSREQIEKTHGNLKVFLANQKIPYFEPVPYLMNPFDKDGHFLFMDVHHLNYYGSLSLVGPLEDFMKKNSVK